MNGGRLRHFQTASLSCGRVGAYRLRLIFVQAFSDGVEEAAQEVDVFGFGMGAGEEVVQAADNAFAVAAVEEADAVHQFGHVGAHARNLRVRCGVFGRDEVGEVGVGLAVDFVGNDLHGLGEVEGEVGGVAGDGHQAVAALHFFDAQAEGFVAEDEGGLLSGAGALQDFGGELARGLQRGGELAFAAGEGAADNGVGKGFVQRGGDAGGVEDVGGAGGEDAAFFGQNEILRLLRVENGRFGGHGRGHEIGGDEDEAGQPHGFHGAGGRADVGGVAGA